MSRVMLVMLTQIRQEGAQIQQDDQIHANNPDPAGWDPNPSGCCVYAMLTQIQQEGSAVEG